jgi:hypothetical protein
MLDDPVSSAPLPRCVDPRAIRLAGRVLIVGLK